MAESGSVPYVVRLDSAQRTPVAVVAAHPVPDVRGLPVRRAVYTLHRAGFRVVLGKGAAPGAARGGAAAGTAPGAGTRVAAGSTVHLAVFP
jgi:beta-lactam-binding protein with PASTA domain